jgi:hypothetical protein
LQLFYLHWLFLIGFYFPFHPWSFDFFKLFSNLVFILLVLNHFLNCFFFSISPGNIYFHLIFMSILVIILLIAIF